MKKENGRYIKIINSLFGAIVQSKNLLTNDGRVFMVILFKTVGFQKQKDWLSYRQICKYSGIGQKTRISESIKNLVAKKLIIREGKYFKVNQNFENWLCLDSEKINVIRQCYLNEKLQKSVTGSNDKLQNIVTSVTEKRNSKLRDTVTPSTDNFIDKTNTDNNIYSRDGPGNNLSEIEQIFNLWNSKKIIIHKSLTSKAMSAISSKLKEGYTQDEITQAIKNYWKILTDDKYFFTYRWTLEKFLQKGFEEFKDFDIARNNYLKRTGNGNIKKHFENERDYTDEDREKIRKKFYRESD